MYNMYLQASGISLQLADGLKVIQLREGQENLTKELENKRKEIEDRMEILKAKWYRFKKKQRKVSGVIHTVNTIPHPLSIIV